MEADAPITVDRRAQLRTLIIARQVAATVAIVGFSLLALALDEPWVWGYVATFCVFLGFGFVVWVSLPYVRSELVVPISLAIDVAIIAFSISLSPYSAQLAIVFLAILTVASTQLSARAAALVTIEAVVLSIASVAWLGNADQLAPTIAEMILLAAVAIVLIRMRQTDRQTRQLLERSERQLRRAEAVSGMGSWQWCPASDELLWSRNMFRMLGLEPDAGQPDYATWTSSLPPKQLEVMEQHAQATLETGEDYTFDSFMERPTGDRMVIRARGARVVDADDQIWLVGTAQDVTELHRVDQLKDEFVATASHELRTPATIILGFARTLDDRWDEIDLDTRRQLVTELRAGGERMSQLIDDVLSLARIEHGELQFTPSPVEILAAITDVVRDLSSPRVTVNIESSITSTKALVDPDRLRQVVYNLVENALRYDPSESPVEVHVAPAPAPGHTTHVIVRVRDHGPGVATADRERIFGRFVRGKCSARTDGGTGLGLYVARSLVERQGGELWIEETPEGGGSVFSFTVPRA